MIRTFAAALGRAACRGPAGDSLPKREIRPDFPEPALTPKCLQTGRFGPINSICFEFKKGESCPKGKSGEFLYTGITSNPASEDQEDDHEMVDEGGGVS